MPPIRRVRQHVNPLSSKYANPADAPDWRDIFADTQRPLHLDIGCGKGDFVREMASKVADWNFLGLEIREPLVERAIIRRDRAITEGADKNLHFVFCNANNSLKPLLKAWPNPEANGSALTCPFLPCPLKCVSIQFPDPWFKKRHQKRRVVQPELVAALAELMPKDAWVWLQSDIEELCVAMCDRFDESPDFHRTDPNWLTESPFPAKTDREAVSEEKGLPVYRAKYIRQ
ncbi:MAG: tRNA (guanine(46)-N(7))-methyltransferase TrmB [Cyanobacteria bacterium P01_F01_bin.86]